MPMLADQYRRQAAWRSWDLILDALPPLDGQTILDLGCAIGDQAALLSARGARVIGIDANDGFLTIARARNIPNAEFLEADLRTFEGVGQRVDGVWSSFTAAYFPNLPACLINWTRDLRPGGWVALVEIDHLFGHEPVDPRTRKLLDGYAHEAQAAGRYDFHMGRRLAGYALKDSRTFDVPDRELSFHGPAEPEVLDAWRARFERMLGLQSFCGGEFEAVREDFLACLQRPDHRSFAKVYACISHR